MINISHKFSTLRYAKATGLLRLNPSTIKLIKDGLVAKGDIRTAAKIAGIESAKRTSDWIIFTHPIPLDHVNITTELREDGLFVTSEVVTVWKTGVEIEAITSVTGALLNALDMLKPHDSDLVMTDIKVVEKSGGVNDFRDAFDPPLSAAVLVISDSTHAGQRKDKSGKVITEILEEYPVTVDTYDILPDDSAKIRERVAGLVENKIKLIITTGGTGFGPKDVTPEAIQPLLEKPAPGVSERMRTYGSDRTPFAMLSREVAGIAGDSLILTLPGSSKGALECMQALFPGVLHIFPMMAGGGHGSKAKHSKN